MRVYHNMKQVLALIARAERRGYERRFIKLNRSIPELRLYKNNIVEVDEYDASRQTYTVYTGYGAVRIWKSACKEIVGKENEHGNNRKNLDA